MNSRLSNIIGCAAVMLIVMAAPAHAMHLSDGILPGSWCVAWTAVALPFIAVAIHMLRRRERTDAFYKPFLAMVGASVFVISCMPVPVPTAGTCSHPCGTGLAAILIGPAMTVLITVVALVLQALLMAHGGVTTLGADVVSMGIAGGFVGWLVFRGARASGLSLFAAGFLAGVLSDWATYATTSIELALALHGTGSVSAMFYTVVVAFIPTQLPLGLLEGALTGGALVFLHERRTDILQRLKVTA